MATKKAGGVPPRDGGGSSGSGGSGGSDRPRSKREILLAALREGMVMLHLDGRAEGVVLPDYLRRDKHVRLDLSYEFRLPDLEIDERGVHATLSFNRTPFTCDVPWESIFAISFYATGQGILFPDDAPAEVREAMMRTIADQGESEAPWKPVMAAARRKRGHLSAVPVEPASPAADGEPSAVGRGDDDPPPPRPRPLLRLVK